MKALELADKYADACFDQALNGRTGDPIPEQKRNELAAELRRLAAVGAERDELRATEAAWRKLNDTLLHQVLCCGVAASHPDATLTTRGAYAGKWNSKQAEAVRALRADRDSLRAELDRIKALEPTHWQVTQGTRSFVMTAAEFNMSTFDYGSFVALYALGSKT